LVKRSGEIVFTFFVISKALAGDILVGDATLYIGFALQATMAFENVTYILLTIYYIGAKRLEKLIQFLAMPVEKQSGQVMPVEEFHSLTFEDVHFTYPLTDKPVLKGVSFSLKKGEKLSIVGINGSGKTTIVKLMLGLYTPQSGRIFINGRPMADYDIAEVRKQFSVLFQDFVRYPLTLRDNVAMSDISRIDDDEEIIAALKLSGIYDEYSKFSNGLDTDMTRRFADEGVELSKGQWQKVALSRAYFKNAPIIILDEPSAALDAEAEDRIFRQFAEISGNRTGIIISHRISGSKLADKIIVLDDGKIVESGKHTDLISQDGLYAKLYNLQLQKYALKEETVDA
jgi:ABC-type multidrug transport system fused ATPase/permease subunit